MVGSLLLGVINNHINNKDIISVQNLLVKANKIAGKYRKKDIYSAYLYINARYYEQIRKFDKSEIINSHHIIRERTLLVLGSINESKQLDILSLRLFFTCQSTISVIVAPTFNPKTRKVS
jgi:hypothetical protein